MTSPLGEPPPIITVAPQRDQGSEPPPGPCQRCDGIPDDVLARLRRALQAKEATR